MLIFLNDFFLLFFKDFFLNSYNLVNFFFFFFINNNFSTLNFLSFFFNFSYNSFNFYEFKFWFHCFFITSCSCFKNVIPIINMRILICFYFVLVWFLYIFASLFPLSIYYFYDYLLNFILGHGVVFLQLCVISWLSSPF